MRLRTLPGYGAFGQYSCHVKNKRVARKMEELVRTIAVWGLEDPAWHYVLDGVKRGEVDLPDLLTASNDGRLEHLKVMMQDPPLADVIEEYKKTDPDYQTENGLTMLLEMAKREFGPKPRFGELRSGKSITLLCARARNEGGRNRSTGKFGESLSHNYVHRSLRNATSKLVSFHFGNVERDRIFADVEFTAEDDTRDLWLNGDQLTHLLAHCPPWFRPLVLVAALSGADRAPLLRLRVRDVEVVDNPELEFRVATIYLRDSKNDTRPRAVALVGPVADTLQELVAGRNPDEKVFLAWFDEATGKHLPLTSSRVRIAFEKAREAAGFTVSEGFDDDLRFKDLRHTAGVAFEKAGLTITEIGAGLGHKRRETSLKYTNRQVQLDAASAFRVAKQLGQLGPQDISRKSKPGGKRG